MIRRKRLYLGIPLAGIALLLLLRVQFAERSQEAVINGTLATLETPIRGILDLGSLQTGDAIHEGESLATVTDPLFDDTEIHDREYQREILLSQIAQRNRRLKDLRQTLNRLEEREAVFHELKIEELSAELAVRQARLAAAQARSEVAEDDLARSEALIQQDAAVLQERDRLAARATEEAQAVEEHRARIRTLHTRLKAHRQGLSIEAGQNDLSATEERLYDLRLLRRSLENQLLTDRSRLQALDREIREEKQYRIQRTQFTLRSTASGRVWSLPSEDGELVRAGETVLEIVDCSSVLVTVRVRRSVYNQLRAGDPALFFPPDGPRLEGEVLLRYGEQAGGLDGRFASSLPAEKEEDLFIVAVEVPGLHHHPELDCAIGRTGRVYFEDGPVGWLRRLLG